MTLKTANEDQTTDIDIKELWNNTISLIKEENPQFGLTLAGIHPININESELTLAVPNDFILNRIKKTILSMIEQTINDSSDQKLTINLEINPEFCKSQQKKIPKKREEDLYRIPEHFKPQYNNSFFKLNLNSEFTFETYVEYSGNQKAIQLSKKFTDKNTLLGSNVLYIFGQNGIGKTHLSQACIHSAKKNDLDVQWVFGPNLKSLWSRVFRESKYEEFNQAFSGKDILCIDSIETVEKAQGTQKKLLEIFQMYAQKNKKIIITSSLNPAQISNNHEILPNLKQLITSGLNVSINEPSLEERILIIKNKIKTQKQTSNCQINSDVIEYMAEHLNKSIRELEGGITSLLTYKMLSQESCTLELAKEIVTNLIGKQDTLTFQDIKTAVCKAYNITIDEIESSKRTKKITYARQIAFYLIQRNAQASLQDIGDAFGKRKHTTVIHGIKKIEEELKYSTQIQGAIEHIQVKLLGQYPLNKELNIVRKPLNGKHHQLDIFK